MANEIGNIVEFISKVAPTLGSLFGPVGSVVGNLAGKGLDMAAQALGCDKTQAAVATAIATDPDAGIKLAKYEMDNKVQILQEHAKIIGMELTDVQDARKYRNKNLYILMWLIVSGFFISLGMLIFNPGISNPNAALLFGSLAAAFGAVIQYNFGTNVSSQSKTDMIYNSTPIKK